MLKTLLFDVDGVLVIGEHWHKGLERTYGITSDQLTPFFKGPFQACLVGKADLKVELASILPRVGWSYSVDAFIFSSVDIGYMKNNPRFFTSILTTLDDCPAENILFWDDTPFNVDTARRTGMVAEIYTGFTDFQAKTRSFLDGLFLI